jgi:uncharacterized membrane protein YwzB
MSIHYPSIYKTNTTGHLFQAIITFLIFLVAIWMYIQPLKFDKVSPEAVNMVALVMMLVTGIIFGISILRLLRPAPELEFLANGFKFKVGTSTIIFIPWESVQELSFVKDGDYLLLPVIISNPAQIIRESKGWSKLVLKARFKNYKTPVLLSSKRLHIDAEELKLSFVQHWNKFRHSEK